MIITESINKDEKSEAARSISRVNAVIDVVDTDDNLPQVSDLSLVLLSGRSGALIGRPVTFNLTAQGKLIGPLLQRTLPGEYYVLFGLGAVEAVSLRSLVALATPGFTPEPFRVKERSWEVLKKSNSSSLLHISRCLCVSEQVDLLLPLLGGGCPALDLNCSGSMFLLLCGAHGASLLRARDLQTVWSLDRGAPHRSVLHTRGAVGGACYIKPFRSGRVSVYFTFSLATVVQHWGTLMMTESLISSFTKQPMVSGRQVQIIDGASGRSLWEMAFVCPRLAVQDWSVLTTSGQSVFLFWAGDPLTNDTKATVPLVRKLFLLHPSYPRILLELRSTTDTVLTAEVSAASPQKDVSYVTVSSRSSAADIPLTHFLTSFRLKDSIASARLTRTHGREEEEDEDSLGLYRRLSFTQVLNLSRPLPHLHLLAQDPVAPGGCRWSSLLRLEMMAHSDCSICSSAANPYTTLLLTPLGNKRRGTLALRLGTCRSRVCSLFQWRKTDKKSATIPPLTENTCDVLK
ncbi:hypothetical protein DNTS_018318 [Danionella cerebrum]|uniref:FAM234A/B beta-propeller domain-containing protein n=1 Tax=Danionella cerebrum TaxID=2873325 RepID=A0A553QEQ8_9TELE|nr:hypothetical protein DNTS_018318 [Danionella translucida]